MLESKFYIVGYSGHAFVVLDSALSKGWQCEGYFEKEQKLISGDVLFHESIGRTDLPGGNHAVLLNSIREKLYKLPDSVEVYPGHGPVTTIGHEKEFNPYCPENI